jgi:hypothetical protein
MLYKLFSNQQEELRALPETGMGYQLIEARLRGEYSKKGFIVLNGELVVENDYLRKDNLREIFSKGFDVSVRNAHSIDLIEIKLINESRLFDVFEDSGSKSSAKDTAIVYPDGITYYVRLSAYEDDKRIDKKNNRLLPGSYTTTKADYEKCVNGKDDPVERYALPNEEKIEWAFHLLPIVKDGYRYGVVQPEFGKKGGGKECFFENGTSFGTFKKQTSYGIFYQ